MTAARAPPPLRGGLQPFSRHLAGGPRSSQGPPFRLRREDLRRPLSREVQHRPQPAEAAPRDPPLPVARYGTETRYGTEICAPGNVANRRPPVTCFSLRRSGYGRPVNHLCPFSETSRTAGTRARRYAARSPTVISTGPEAPTRRSPSLHLKARFVSSHWSRCQGLVSPGLPPRDHLHINQKRIFSPGAAMHEYTGQLATRQVITGRQ